MCWPPEKCTPPSLSPPFCPLPGAPCCPLPVQSVAPSRWAPSTPCTRGRWGAYLWTSPSRSRQCERPGLPQGHTSSSTHTRGHAAGRVRGLGSRGIPHHDSCHPTSHETSHPTLLRVWFSPSSLEGLWFRPSPLEGLWFSPSPLITRLALQQAGFGGL